MKATLMLFMGPDTQIDVLHISKIMTGTPPVVVRSRSHLHALFFFFKKRKKKTGRHLELLFNSATAG